MLKNRKILLILSTAFFMIALALFINIKIIRVNEEIPQQLESEPEVIATKKVLSPEDIKNLKIKYDEELLLITGEYDRIINNAPEASKKEELEKLRTRMLDLVIPEEYKKTHLELVLTFSKINEILNEEEKNIVEAEALLARAKEKYQSLDKI